SKKELPTKTAFRISRNHRKLIEEVKTADEMRSNLIDKYRDEQDENKIKEDKKEEFKKEFDELMEQEVDIKLSKIKLFELGESVKPKVLFLLETIIDDEEED